jgi:lysophospholipase L1-like esterase
MLHGQTADVGDRVKEHDQKCPRWPTDVLQDTAGNRAGSHQGRPVQHRRSTLMLALASIVGIATISCSQSSPSSVSIPDSGVFAGGHGAGGTGRQATSGAGGAIGATGGATVASGGAGPGDAAGSARGGSTGSGGSGSGGSGGSVGGGGTPATGGLTGNGDAPGTGGFGMPDASYATGGRTGTGGTTGLDDGGADRRPSDGAVGDLPAPDAPGDITARDTLLADLSQGDAPVDNRQSDGGSTCTLSGSATSKTPTVYVIGDSTASVYTSDLYPRMGWAQPLQDFFAPACATISDKALSGRSSKSFWDEGDWTPIKNGLRAGDYVIIQFGHNDEKSDDSTRYTEPFTTYEDYLSKYIDDTVAKGAFPILATPINRNNWSGSTLQDTHGNYPVAMRELAQKRKVTLVDATALTKGYFERIGQSATTKLFMNLAAGEFPNYPDGNTDNTHLQEKGARIVAQLVLADLYRQNLAPGTLAKTIPVAP